MTPRKTPASDASLHEDLYDQPGHLLRRAHQIAMGMFADLVGPDITPTQFAILRMVLEQPGIDQVSLAKLIALDNSTAAQTAVRLEKRGLLSRQVSETDRRLLSLTLTESGERLLQQTLDGVHTMRTRLLSPLNPQERAIFMELLAKFVQLNNQESRAPLQSGKAPAKTAPATALSAPNKRSA
ncbi:MAG: MarR family transcriptional regulator [Pigmentiphaga sp.]